MKKIKITYQEKTYLVDPFITPLEFIDLHKIAVKKPVASIINGHLTRLNKHMRVDSTLSLVELETYQGQRIYESSVLFLFVVAFTKKFPDLHVFIQHSVYQGIFAETKERSLATKEIQELNQLMQEMVEQSLPIERMTQDWDVTLNELEEIQRQDLINLHRYVTPTQLRLYHLGGIKELFYLPLLINTSYLQEFQLVEYQNGIVIQFPDYEKQKKIMKMVDHTKLFQSYKEYHSWGRILKIRTVGQLNRYIMNNDITQLILITESLHEKRCAKIADEIISKSYLPRLILIAGPSSSGKTTFSKRLDIQLRVNGLRPVTISLDNYFLNREQTPKNPDGSYDFESLKAIDVNLFSNHLTRLLRGEEVEIPEFDFHQGTKKYNGNRLQLAPDQLIIIEGIHGLNPQLTSQIEERDKFKIYVSALTQLNLHRHDRVPTSDTRLIRRIVRDSLFRGYSAGDTLIQWQRVRTGEGQNIFPFQEEADIIFNSALFYELSVLKGQAERELLKIEQHHPMYAEAQRLLTFLSYFLPLDSLNVPKTSLLREFIGGSAFRY